VQNFAPDLRAAPQLVQNFACGLAAGVGAAAAAGGGVDGTAAAGGTAGGAAGVDGDAGDAGDAGVAGDAAAVTADTFTASNVTAVVVPALIHIVSSNARPPYAARIRYFPAGN